MSERHEVPVWARPWVAWEPDACRWEVNQLVREEELPYGWTCSWRIEQFDTWEAALAAANDWAKA